MRAIVIVLLLGISSLAVSQDYGSFTDSRDGHVYKTVEIGEQVWMAENLAYLPSINHPLSGSIKVPYYYVSGYQGNSVKEAKARSYYEIYGVLYNWPAAKSACPDGWHLPSDKDWTALTDYLGGEGASAKLREEGTVHWKISNEEITNETGFTALPGAYRAGFGITDIGTFCYWWSSSSYESENAWFRVINCYGSNNVSKNNYSKEYGFSVRCLRD